MNLVEQQTAQSAQTNSGQQHQRKADQRGFLRPFKTFQKSISLSIKIHFLRFLFVTAIYFYSDIFLINQNHVSQPWNSLLYFLVIMIEIIKFIGDCSLRNLLKNQQHKICQIHNFKLKSQQTNHNSQNITLKGAKYEDYLHMFSLIRIFKYQHKNYSSAFSISKFMHLISTFLIFGWMSLTEQYKEQTNWIQLAALQGFLYSIYFTSFEIDLFLIQTSDGKASNQNHYNVSVLSDNQTKIVLTKFKKWRQNYLIIQTFGTLLLLLGVFIHFQASLVFYSVILVLIINLIGFKIEQVIKKSSKSVVKSIRRDQINTYSLLKKSTAHFKKVFELFIIIQRFLFVFLWFSFARDQSLELQNFFFLGLGIFLLALSQINKFSQGNKLKLMSILQDSYPNNIQSESQQQKQLQCAICLKYFDRGDIVNFLPCSKDHIFHSNCFEDWKKIKTQCPLCRYPLSEYI